MKTKRKPKRGAQRAQLSLEAMLSFAAYAALVAAFVFAARQTSDAAAPKTAFAAGAADALQSCALLEYAQINARHSLADLPSLEKTSFSASAAAAETRQQAGGATGTSRAGEASVECAAAARSQGRTVVKQYDKEQA